MNFNGNGVFLDRADQAILGISHTDFYPLSRVRGDLIDVVEDSLAHAVQAECTRFDELREEWDTVEEAFAEGYIEGGMTVWLARLVVTLESIAREQ